MLEVRKIAYFEEESFKISVISSEKLTSLKIRENLESDYEGLRRSTTMLDSYSLSCLFQVFIDSSVVGLRGSRRGRNTRYREWTLILSNLHGIILFQRILVYVQS